MILNYYALQSDPFSPTSHPAWFFASRSHTAALQTLLASLKAGQALAILLGEPGVGKTFLVHVALAHSDLQDLKMVHLWYPPCSFHGLTWCTPTGATCYDNGTLTAPCNKGQLSCYQGAWICSNRSQVMYPSCACGINASHRSLGRRR